MTSAKISLRLRLADLLAEFKPEDILQALAHRLSEAARAAYQGMDFQSADAFDAMADDLFSQPDRLANINASQEDRSDYLKGRYT